ncbi:MAG: hypothetical protein H6667_03970 [Ardenticatenaceae bacterium]|nr:hypothetical protein [Ardenticatenaceae bacterium]MCB9446635.1 hypothetical protein [Ardenticatenaceae bacterium]
MGEISIIIKHNATIHTWDSQNFSDPINHLGIVNSRIEVKVDDQWTTNQLIAYLIRNHFIPPSFDTNSYVLTQDNIDGVVEFDNEFFELLPTTSLFERGIRDGDVLNLWKTGMGGGGIPYRSYREIQLVNAIIQENARLDAFNHHTWFAIFLYTEEDRYLADYIRNHIIDLDEMSEPATLFFVLEKPTQEWNLRLKRLLGELGGPYFDHLWYRFGEDNFKPVDQSQAYSIARNFGVLPSDLPCIIIFERLDSENILPIKLANYLPLNSDEVDFAQFFRILFSSLQRVSKDTDDALKKLNKELNIEIIRQQLPKIQSVRLPDKKTILDIIAFIAKLFGLV